MQAAAALMREEAASEAEELKAAEQKVEAMPETPEKAGAQAGLHRAQVHRPRTPPSLSCRLHRAQVPRPRTLILVMALPE